MLQIWIPTRGRKILTTLESFPPELRKRTIVVVSHDNAFTDFDCADVLMAPSYVTDIATKRQWILSIAHTKFVMLDDDLTFATRRSDDCTKFSDATPESIINLFDVMETLLDTFAHVGVSGREGANRISAPYIENARMMRILAYRADVLLKHSIDFARGGCMCDFDVTLQLLRLGYKNILMNWMVQNQKSSNAPGGCSIYRTMGVQEADARRLHENHPKFVTCVTKTTKGAWNGQTRTDVRVQWKRAFDRTRTSNVLDS